VKSLLRQVDRRFAPRWLDVVLPFGARLILDLRKMESSLCGSALLEGGRHDDTRAAAKNVGNSIPKFLSIIDGGRTSQLLPRSANICSGRPSDAVFYIQKEK